jgi:GTP-binding protein
LETLQSADNIRLRRAFLLVDALHGLKKTDEQILKLFRHNAVPHQVMLSKVDRILFPNTSKKNISENIFAKNVVQLQGIVEKIREKIQPRDDGPPALGEILTVSADMDSKWLKLAVKTQGVLGISALRWAVLSATGFNQHTADLKIQPTGLELREEQQVAQHA